MPAIPNTEPTTITAGETLAWTQTVADYPATAWTLKYVFQAIGVANIAITATASGSSYAVNVTAAVSAVYTAGVYLWTSYVEQGTGSTIIRHEIARGQTTIIASPLAALGSTHASQVLALIEAALVSRIPRGLETTDIDGQQLSRIPILDLHRLRDKYRREVFMEKQALLAQAGLKVRRTIGIKFVSA
jgi:hypothetical protein